MKKKCEILYGNRVALYFQAQNNEAYYSRGGSVHGFVSELEKTSCANLTALIRLRDIE